MENYLEEIYDRNFEMYYDFMESRKRTDPGFRKEDLRDLLESFYSMQGNNWIGRSEAKETAHQAMIAACEVILSNWSDSPELT